MAQNAKRPENTAYDPPYIVDLDMGSPHGRLCAQQSSQVVGDTLALADPLLQFLARKKLL
jgi:hypothetical protein